MYGTWRRRFGNLNKRIRKIEEGRTECGRLGGDM
jgi:hypothetical protein